MAGESPQPGDSASLSIDEEIARLRVANQEAARENNRLRGDLSDRQLEVEQLDKQIRKLERKIDVLEDANRKSGGVPIAGHSAVRRGFLQSAPSAQPTAAASTAAPPPALAAALAKAQESGHGIIIDGATGKEVDPKAYWPDDEDGGESNPLLRSSGKGANAASLEERLMLEMQNPLEVNPDFDSQKYAALIAAGHASEAEEMVKSQGGPSLAQMQRVPLSMLERYPQLDPNWCDPKYHRCSLAQWAASMGFAEVLSALLQRRADANHRSGGGVSCLSTACAHNQLDCARLLLAHRANPNEVLDAGGGQSILMWAARVDYCEATGAPCPNPVLEELLAHRADVGLVDNRGKTALIHACTHGSVQAVQVLLAAGADAEARDKEGQTALQVALRCYHGEVSSILATHSCRQRQQRQDHEGESGLG